jgi:hypothetical protein
MIIATVELKTKGILPVAEKEIFAAGYKQAPSTNGIKTVATNKAANGSGLKSKYWPLENGSVNIRIIPTDTISSKHGMRWT